MSWLVAIAMLVLGVLLGIISSIFIQDQRPVKIWAIFVSVVFFVAAVASVLTHYSWMFSADARTYADSVTLAAGVTGLVFSMRSSD